MTVTLVGPGGRVEVDNEEGNPLPVVIVGGIVLPGEVEVSNDAGNPVGVSATDLDIRDLLLGRDSVRQTARPMKPFHRVLAAGASATIAVAPGDRLRVLRVDGGCRPSTPAGVFPSYAINLDVGDGDEVVRGKELQTGEPIGCTVCLEGVAGADLTVAVSGAGGTVEFDIYHEFFT